MDIVLVPGLWLHGSSWDRVVPHLQAAGHRTHPLTLPGMEGRDADRTGVTLADHVAAVVGAVDAAEDAVLLVGHSAGCGIAHAALDARPDRVAHVVHVGGFPTPSGRALLPGLPAVDGEVPMPDWVELGEEANVRDMDDDARARLYAAAIPVPQAVVEGLVELHDVRRLEVPATAVCPEYSVDDLRDWVASGDPGLAELTALTDVTYVDLPGGHWPQLTQPGALAEVLLEAASRA